MYTENFYYSAYGKISIFPSLFRVEPYSTGVSVVRVCMLLSACIIMRKI